MRNHHLGFERNAYLGARRGDEKGDSARFRYFSTRGSKPRFWRDGKGLGHQATSDGRAHFVQLPMPTGPSSALVSRRIAPQLQERVRIIVSLWECPSWPGEVSAIAAAKSCRNERPPARCHPTLAAAKSAQARVWGRAELGVRPPAMDGCQRPSAQRA